VLHKLRIVAGAVLPEEITNELSIHPTKTWLAGDNIQGTSITRKHNGWCLVKEENCEDVGKLANRLLKVLLPKAQKINHIRSKYNLECELSVVIYIEDEVPEINFSPEIIIALSDLHAAVDIDVILINDI